MRKWIVLFSASISGLVFGFGLILSGMINPAIVLAFLDIAGQWNPSLLWVMGGAVAVSAVAFFIARRRSTSFLGSPVNVPTSRVIDKRLFGYGRNGQRKSDFIRYCNAGRYAAV
jgi:uncharacterized protein